MAGGKSGGQGRPLLQRFPLTCAKIEGFARYAGIGITEIRFFVLRQFSGIVFRDDLLLQVVRDPSSILVTVILPPVLLAIFAFAVSFEVEDLPYAVVMEADDTDSRSLAAAFQASPYLDTRLVRHRNEVEELLVSGEVRGIAIIPVDFQRRLNNPHQSPEIQLITDGSLSNTANFAVSYGRGVFAGWLASRAGNTSGGGIQVEQRFWFNAEMDSFRVVAPGAIALVMTMIGTLLTALVVAREWERG